VDPKALRAFLESEVGRETLRRELAEGTGVRAGQQALLLCDVQASDVGELEIQLTAQTLRELGLTVTIMRLEEFIPQFPGSIPVAFVGAHKLRLPKIVFEAIRAADVTFNFTLTGRGATKYNVDFYTLITYYNKQIDGGRTVEGAEVLWSDADPNAPNLEAIQYPSDLLRVIGDRANEVLFAATEQQEEFQLTNPWGTDIRFTALPGDVTAPAGGARKYPWPPTERFRGEDAQRLYRALSGFGVVQSCDGVWVTKYCPLLGGELSEPMHLTLKEGFIAEARGGPEARRLLQILDEHGNVGIHAILWGLNPKASPFKNGKYLHNNNGIGVGIAHIGIGGPGLFYHNQEWGTVGNNHFELGNIPKISVRAGDTWLVQDGWMPVLADPAVREAAARFGDPDELLRPFEWRDITL